MIAHSSIADELTDRLAAAYRSLPIGSPLADGTLVGRLINTAAAYRGYAEALAQAQADGGKIVAGGRRVLAARRRGLLRGTRDRSNAGSK